MNAETRHNERIAELEEALRKEREKTPAELIELAWERAYPVPVGETIPAGTRCMYRMPVKNSETGPVLVFRAGPNIKVTQWEREHRTFEPLTPAWQRASVVIAHTEDDPARRPFIRTDDDVWVGLRDNGRLTHNLLNPTPVELPEEEQE